MPSSFILSVKFSPFSCGDAPSTKVHSLRTWVGTNFKISLPLSLDLKIHGIIGFNGYLTRCLKSSNRCAVTISSIIIVSIGGKSNKKWGLALRKPCYLPDNNVMQPLHKNEKLLFNYFQVFLVRKQHAPENVPSCLIKVSTCQYLK